MKLNLGCGGDYKKGYLNVDAYDSNVADKIINAYDIEYDDNSFEEILMSQLIEHLGIAGSIQTLSECFRILEPDGKLVIETPDLQKSFEIYVNGQREDRKNILPWIYGVDNPGMLHRFCFPYDLLEQTLKEIGFEEIKISYFDLDEYEPVLKVVCKKPKSFDSNQLISYFRKRLLKEGLFDLDQQITSLEKNDLINFFSTELNKYLSSKNPEIIKKIFVKGAIKSPYISIIFFEVLRLRKIINEDIFNKYHRLLLDLRELDFPNILIKILIETEGFFGEQEKLITIVENLGKKTVENFIDKDDIELIKDLKQKFKSINHDEKIEYFSSKLIMLKSNRFFQIGIKEFNLENYNEAIKHFKKSIDFHRGQFFSYWNLARLYSLKKDAESSKSFYDIVIRILDRYDFKNKNELKQVLFEEIENKNNINEPVSSFI